MTMVAGLFIVFLLSYMVTSTQKMQKLFSNPFMINGKNKLMYVRDIYILHMLRTFIVKFFLDLSFTFDVVAKKLSLLATEFLENYRINN